MGFLTQEDTTVDVFNYVESISSFYYLWQFIAVIYSDVNTCKNMFTWIKVVYTFFSFTSRNFRLLWQWWGDGMPFPMERMVEQEKSIDFTGLETWGQNSLLPVTHII